MVDAIFELAVHYGLTYNGQTIESLIAGGYEVKVQFDDSIIQDRQQDINQGTMLVGAGLMSKKKFMMDTLGYTEEDADKEIAQIAEEGRSNAIDVTRLFGGVGE